MTGRSSKPDTALAMPKEVEALRGLLETRLAALESALDDPSQHGSLEQLILDLARLATEEADATARRAFLYAQREAQTALGAVRAEAHAALEMEQTAAAALRRELEQARAALQTLEQERAAAAKLQQELTSTRQILEKEQAATASLRRELEQARGALKTLEQERTAAAAVRKELETAHQLIKLEQQARGSVQKELESAQHALKAEQKAAESGSRELAQARVTLQQFESASSALRQELAQASAELQKLGPEKAAHDADRRQLAEARDKIAALEKALGAAQRDVQMRSKTLSGAQDALDLALKEAEARADAAVAEQLAMADKLEAATAAAAAAETAAQARYTELHEAAERHNRALDLKLRDVEARAESTQRELDELRRAGDDAPPAPAKKISAAAPNETPGEEPKGPSRESIRNPMPEVEIQIDGSPAWLIDLSLSGAQILATIALKPNRAVKITLPLGNKPIPCKGKIVWAKLEPGRGGLRYRAGVAFANADEEAIEAFLKHHRRKA